MRLLLRALPWLGRVKGHLAILLGLWFVVGAISLVAIVSFLPLMWNSLLGDAALSPGQAALLGSDPTLTVGVTALPAAVRHELARAWTLRVLGLLPLLMGGVLAVWYYQVWILQRINQILRLELFDRLQALSLRFHHDNRVGDAIYRTYQDSAMVTQLLEVLILTPLGAVFRFLTGLVAVALFAPSLALLLAVTWVPALILGRIASRGLRTRFRRARETNSALTSWIQETLSGIRVIKAYGLERQFQRRFETDSRRAFRAAFAARSWLAAFGVGMFWVVSVSALSASFAGVTHTLAGAAPALWTGVAGTGTRLEAALLGAGFTVWNLGSYNAFTFLFGWGSGALQQLMHVWGRTQDTAIGLDRVFEWLDHEPEVLDRPGARRLDGLREGIAFEEVSFAYQPDRPTLHRISLAAKVGTVTAIVGPTGSGKTTLMALLLRLFDPQSGRVTIDGCDLREFQVASLRRQVAIALQENVLFGTTVRENIRYAVPDASDARVREAAQIACADAFIETLPDGYDTLLGERGMRLSTGQRQRLSVARAVLKNAPVLILDEPTASLDAETELRMLDRLEAWGRRRGCVIFLVTHRLSSVRRSGQIAVLSDGRLLETGPHEDLLTRPNGVYREWVESENPEAA
ncbi:MAG: ABC transporter ATP-binding protein [Myxococcota bacterium]